jgi:hypothetical protein
MHNVRENRTSSTARFHPELVWVSPRNLVSFSWLRDVVKNTKSLEHEGDIPLNEIRLRQSLLLLNQFRLEMDINAGSLVILIIVIQNKTW